MKKLLLQFVIILISLNGLSQDRILSIYAGGGFQDYRGDRGNGLWDHERCTWGSVHFGADLRISNSFDVKLLLTGAHMGYIQKREVKLLHWEMEENQGEPETHIEELEDLSSAMYSASLNLQYKFANGYLLKQSSRLAPAVYLGIGVNEIKDIMKMNCVNVGTYCTINVGLSIPYRFLPRVYLAYNLDFGFFTSDKLDFVDKGGNDLHMQNSLVLGFDLIKRR